jgi:hypothetical protein
MGERDATSRLGRSSRQTHSIESNPNNRLHTNAAIALYFHGGRPWLGVGDMNTHVSERERADGGGAHWFNSSLQRRA